MKKLTSKILSFILILSMIFTSGVSSFASEASTGKQNITAENSYLTETGVYNNGEYYTKDQLVQLLDTAVQVKPSPENITPQSAIGVIAGTWWIPGVGEVVITTAGVILLAGVIYEAGTWIYDTVVKWFADRAVQQAYEDAKDAGEPTDEHSSTTGSSLPTTGSPNSSKDLKDSEGIKQRRYYDKDGNADMDIDYRHGGTGHTFPHRHDWNDGVRGDAY